MRNQERVWSEEKRALEERKRIDQLRRERDEERQMQEIQRLHEASGKPKQHNRVDWMYQAPSSATGQYSEEMEGYLLGKRRIDGILLKNDTDNQKLEKGADLAGANAVAAAAAGPSVGSQRDTMTKVMADPLFEVKKREQAAYEAMVKETMRRKEREEKRGARDGDRDRDSKRRRYSHDAEDERRSRHHRSSRRHRSRSPGRSHRGHRSERDRDDRDRREDRRRGDGRDRKDEDTRSRRDDRDRNRDRGRRDDRERRDSYTSRRDRHDRRDQDNDRTRSPHASPRQRSPSPRPTEDRSDRRDYPRRDHSNGLRASGRDRGPPPPRPVVNKPDPKEQEEERRRKLAEMQSNANDLETGRRQRIAEITTKEEQQAEADNRTRSDRGQFMSQIHKRAQEDTLDERIKRSRGGLSRMEED